MQLILGCLIRHSPVSMSPKKASGCGCANIPVSLIIVILGGGYWWFIHLGNINTIIKLLPSNITELLPNNEQATLPTLSPTPTVLLN